jgi:hypothetical protein
MRTTVVIEDALMDEIASTAQKEHSSMKKVLNRTVARGLGHCAEKPAAFTCEIHDLGVARLNIDDALKAADLLEEEAVIGKMELNK